MGENVSSWQPCRLSLSACVWKRGPNEWKRPCRRGEKNEEEIWFLLFLTFSKGGWYPAAADKKSPLSFFKRKDKGDEKSGFFFFRFFWGEMVLGLLSCSSLSKKLGWGGNTSPSHFPQKQTKKKQKKRKKSTVFQTTCETKKKQRNY